ncbi:MAG: hypothetical protein J1E85_01430 [Ruminococcus sp.]|nr:hypothetical protein [Ruminococcus sp.]
MNNSFNKTKISPFSQEIRLSEILSLLFTKLPFILIAGIVLCSCSFLFSKFFISPKYETYVTLFVYNNPEQGGKSESINNNDLLAAESLAQTYKVILGSNVVLDSVMDEVKETNNVSISRNELQNYIDVSVVDETQLLKLTVRTNDANLSYYVANAFAKVSPQEIVRVTKAGGVEVVDHAEISSKPSSPNVLMYSIYGFFAGAIICSLYFIIRMMTDNTIYTVGDIENTVEASVLGSIPKFNLNGEDNRPWTAIRGGAFSYDHNKRRTSTNESEE